MIKIDNRNIFFEKLRTGINLFTGAGFSVLPSPSGIKLPTTSDLCKELCEEFNVNQNYSNDIEKISTLLKINTKNEFNSFLREKFKVADYNPLYDTIDKINISSIITTNIDNIIPLVIEKSSSKYLNNVSYYGPIKRDGHAIQYIPLHGDVTNTESELYFGKFELCNADHKNHGLFSLMESAMLCNPTLFIGYGFHDGSVLRELHHIISDGKQDIWIQLLPNSEDIDFFREMGFNVIIADTEELLNEINSELSITNSNESKNDINPFFNEYAIPSLNSIESMPIRDFYEDGKTHWYYVLTNKAYQTKIVDKVINTSLANKNTIVVGIPIGGKTTTLMQIACKYGRPTYFLDNINDAKANLICNNAKKSTEEYVLLIDNCSEDMCAYKKLAECKNIRTIATTDDFMYESSKHILDTIDYKKIDIPDIEYNEAQRIFSNIPNDLKIERLKYKQLEEDKYSVFELITYNIKNLISPNKIEDSLNKVKNQNKEAFEIILLTAYLVYNRSALNMDVLIGYFNTTDIEKINHKIAITQSYLSEINLPSIEQDEIDQGYYSLRSAIFAKYTHEVAVSKFKNEYAKVIKKFIKEVPPCYIYKNYVFRRTAYDADLFFKICPNNGDELYAELNKNDPSAYTLQQWALYKAKTQRFPDAFSDIDKALHMQPNNFSIKNARAIILFEANKNKSTIAAKNSLEEAMNILDECYRSDKRKVYHAQKYAEFALQFSDIFSDNKYIQQAYTWLTELIENKDSMSRKTKNLQEKLKQKN